MSLKFLMLHTVCLLLITFGAAETTQAKTYRLSGNSGGQIHFEAERPIPLQPPHGATGPVFPPLLIPVVPGATVEVTAGGKLLIPAGILSRPAAQNTLGVFSLNPTFHALATNLGIVWPSAPATLSVNGRTGLQTTSFVAPIGGSARYSPLLSQRFGGPAQFAFSPGPPAGVSPGAPVTTFGVAVPVTGAPPCTHTSLTPVPFPGPGNPACIGVIGNALPTGLGGIGGPAGTAVTTPGGTPAAVVAGGPVPGIGIGKFGGVPAGTVSFFTLVPSAGIGFTNQLSSYGYPFTIGRVTVSQPAAGELYTITGRDELLAGGTRNIQLVAGGLTKRTLTGLSTGRAWIRLELMPPVTHTFEVVGASTGGQWSWRIEISGNTVASNTGVGPITLSGAASLFATEFISSISMNAGSSNCQAAAVMSKPNEFTVTCLENFTFIVGDATATPMSECTVVTTLGTGGLCTFNPTISLVGSGLPLLGPWSILTLVGLLLLTPLLFKHLRRSAPTA